MRKRDWREYNKHLVQQGSISFLIDPKIFRSTQNKKGSRGRPLEFSEDIIQIPHSAPREPGLSAG